MLTYQEDKTAIKTIYITAVAPISNNYTRLRAQKKAEQIAHAYAEQTLIRILNSKVKSSSTMKSDMTDNAAYASTKISLSETISSESSAIIAGLIKVASDPDRDGSYVAIYVWNNTINAGLKEVSSSMKETSKDSVAK
ncbi:hypothetical protein [Intestinicryptomonas porci]|uniref:Uncharacterized protein n=1 Tax=Intestinicryptomonas porci TaxID=2926320 RepID=A0ABU4WE98_9BACT|nr:hypothetical protein [Opitutales bacterium CLA-KB-P66]